MQYKFSQKLRNQIAEYFQEYYSLTISDEQADQYLDSLSNLYLAFNSMRE
jgi:chromosome condensin MukBEF complex kleisin-like MukF subunit